MQATRMFWASSELKKDLISGDINNQITAINYLYITINNLLVKYPELKNTEELKMLVDAPRVEVAYYNGYASIYNDTLVNSTVSGFEELPYCIMVESKIEY